MAISKAKTVEEYLDQLPPDRREALEVVRKVILENLDKDYEEGMNYGAIGYYVPHRVHPAGYHCDPSKAVPFTGLGSQKHYMALGIMSTYLSEAEGKWFRAAWAKTGKKLDMGACCIRFKKIDDLPLDVIAEAIRRTTPQQLIAQYEANMSPSAKKKSAAKKKLSKPAAKKTSAKRKTSGRARAR